MLRLMISVFASAVGCLLLVLTIPGMAVESSDQPLRTDRVEVRNEMVPMRDGVALSTDIFRPKRDGRLPVIIARTPYSSCLSGEYPRDLAREMASFGYVSIVQDCRGTARSEGKWDPYVYERTDGMDTLRWASKQPWCNGQIGMFGGSYLGYTQLSVAVDAGESLGAMVPEVPTYDWHETTYHGGAFTLEARLIWNTLVCRPGADQDSPPKIDVKNLGKWPWHKAFRHLPLRTWDEQIGVEIPWMRESIAHPEFDDYLRKFQITDQLNRIRAPSLIIDGWYDIFLSQVLRYGPEFQKNSANRGGNHRHIVIGPWGHSVNSEFPERNLGEHSKIDHTGIHKDWFDHWLKQKPNGVDKWPLLRIFVMGENCWRYEDEWPLARTQFKPYYFRSGGSANTLGGDGWLSKEKPLTEPMDQYVYDPEDPVPTHGGEWRFFEPYGPLDQREIEKRTDILVYTSDALRGSVEVTGPVKVVLYAASDARDTDWTAKLVDVYPDGRAFNLCDGIIRARYRESLAKAKLLAPGEVCRYEIDLWATSNVFLAGHSIRVEISSSNFPRFDRNPNTGHPFGVDAELQKANQTIYHDQEHPSHILLPVIPR